jgi:cell division protein FtsB
VVYYVCMKRQRTQDKVHFLRSKTFLIILSITAVLFVFNYARGYYQDYALRQEIAALEDEMKSLQNKKIESLEILKYVSSQAFVEEKARTELGLRKPEENVVVVSNQAGNVQINDGTGVNDDRYLSNIRKWWYYFRHIQT